MAMDPKRQLGGGVKTMNEQWFDSLLRHQIHAQRYAGGVRNKVIELLNDTEADLADIIRKKMKRSRQGLTKGNRKRFTQMMRQVRDLRNQAWGKATKELTGSMRAFAEQEGDFLVKSLNKASHVQLDLSAPAPEQLKSLVTQRPFEGRTLKEWAQNLQRNDIQRIQDQVRIGMVQGESNQQIARRVVGTKAAKGRDGITQLTRRQTEAVTRTATAEYSQGAREEFAEANKDIFDKELFVATLDARTTLVCAGNDGKTFKRGEGPRPPLHYQCRSLRVPEVDKGQMGERPARNYTQKQLEREYADQAGFKKPLKRADLPRGHKGKFDDFARKRKRELTGTVPAKTSYPEWLKNQPAGIQDDILGRERAKLFRQGKVSIDKFTDSSGRTLTLDQLKAKMPADPPKVKGLRPGTKPNDRWIEEMTPEYREAVKQWSEAHGDIREYWLTGEGPPEIAETAEFLDEALAQAAPHEGTIYRGMNLSRAERDSFLDDLKRNGGMENKAFSSASHEEEIAASFMEGDDNVGIFMRIENKSGVNIERASTYEDEMEVVMRPGARYRLKRIGEPTKDGDFEMITIDLEEI